MNQRSTKGSQHRDASQTQKLDELGFRWDTTKEVTWEERFQRLKEFKEEHGHCNVPREPPGGLGDWVKYQRSKRGSQYRSACQSQKLEELWLKLQEDFKDDGLSIVVGTRTTQTSARFGKMSDNSEARFQQLKEFKEEHSYCIVPQKHPGGLGHWVKDQRHDGKERYQCRYAEQTQKLENLGFQWGIAGIDSDRWEAWF